MSHRFLESPDANPPRSVTTMFVMPFILSFCLAFYVLSVVMTFAIAVQN